MNNFTQRFTNRTAYCYWLIKHVKRASSLVLFMLFLFSVTTVKAQITLGSDVVGGFGVDADVYSGELGPVSGNSVPSDDWFIGSNGGNGIIDVSDVPAGLLAGTNLSFTLGQSVPAYTPVLAPDGLTYLWIDAFYNRDPRTDGNKVDNSFFTSGSDSNADNPTTWTVGEGSGGPQKNDIVDTYLHIREDPNGKIWAYFGVSTRATNGTSYLDVEFYRKGIDYSGGVWTSGGEDDGRTAYVFDMITPGFQGSIVENGDVSFSMNYENGGGAADTRVFIWMDLNGKDDTWFELFNSYNAAPFTFGDGNGNFPRYDGGEGTTTFGYAQVQLGVEAYAQVNEFNEVDGPDGWDTVKPGGQLYANYSTLQFAEFAVDGTFLSLDINGEDQPCEPFLGSVMVKTRSSTSFVSELKDLVGPIQFGNTRPLEIEIVSTNPTCNDEDGTSDDGSIKVEPSPYLNTITYSINDGNGYSTPVLGSELDGHLFSNLPAGTYMVKAQLPAGCYVEEEVVLINPDAFSASATGTDVTCNDEDGTSDDGSIDATLTNGVSPFTYSWTGPDGYTASTEDISGLAAGTYNLEVTDDNGCKAYASYEVMLPEAFSASATGTDVTSDNDEDGTSDDGSIDATLTNGVSPFTYSWTGPDGYTASTEDISGLAAGTYNLEVTDDNGCKAYASYEVMLPEAFSASATGTDVTCNDEDGTSDDGSIDATLTNGVSPFTYSWTGPDGYTASTEDISGLAAGTYNLEVTDDNGCKAYASYEVMLPEAFSASATGTDVT
ncbi:SprB repeat-containing protein [Aestuariibaculum sp. YM273]|uniref:SprB repeat-containing protein n=1 Tax=Aestuariibaculum sp. YM273 TaxID=3070659 RepID=UPI0027DBE731|nr:SprB repeat-containing protein [Aestuariibaculum sp. YM273]WMI65040.1 SprB repeat-containing protein [Aestuariibaculum sp. YM273]